jgi:hypothetical protein
VRRRTATGRDLYILAALIATGTAIRTWIAFTNRGVAFDIDSLYIVAALLKSHPLHVYDAFRWPYPGGYLPVVAACRWFADLTGAAFYAVIKLPAIAADAGIAAAVYWGLGMVEAPRAERLGGAALVALGPIFVLISGYHGQIDAAATLPGLLGLLFWQRAEPTGGARALPAGLLVGLGASIKTVPLFLLLAMLPHARTRREAATLVASAIAVPLFATAPFLAADGHEVLKVLHANKGVPGFGGLSVFVQPGLIRGWLIGPPAAPTAVTSFLVAHQNAIVGVGALAGGALAWWRGLDAMRATAVIWAAVYLCNPDWSYQYFVWGLPFFLVARLWPAVVALQLLLALPAAELYFKFAVHSLRWLYLPLVAVAWLALVAIGAWLAVAHLAGRRVDTLRA